MMDSPEVCNICDKTMVDPKILSCSHTFCLKCLEFYVKSKELSNCPTCRISFKIPDGGLKDLKKNEFVEMLKSCKESEVNCDSCAEAQAVKYCVECSYNYCSTCLDHHKKFPATSTHLLQKPGAKPERTSMGVQYQTCGDHSEIINLHCEECHVLICGQCLMQKHKTHEIKHIVEHLNHVKNLLEQELKMSERFERNILNGYEKAEKLLNANILNASELKIEIQQRGKEVKEAVDFHIAKMTKYIDKELEIHKNMAEHVLVKLKNMEMKSKTDIQFLKEKLKDLNFINISKSTRSTSTTKEEIIPEYNLEFNLSFCHDKMMDQVCLEGLTGTLSKDHKFEQVNMQRSEEKTLRGSFSSVALMTKQMHLSCFEAPEIWTFDRQGEQLKSTRSLKKELAVIYDLLSLDNNLIVLGKPLGDEDSFKLLKVDMLDGKLQPWQIFGRSALRISQCILSRSHSGDILLVLDDEIIHLSDSGDVLKTVRLPFVVDRALQVDRCRYCCYNRDDGIFLVDGLGQIIMRHSPNEDSNDVVNPILTCDGFGRIYLCYLLGKVLVLDPSLNFVALHQVGELIYKIHYDKDFDRLLFLTATSPTKLIVYDL